MSDSSSPAAPPDVSPALRRLVEIYGACSIGFGVELLYPDGPEYAPSLAKHDAAETALLTAIAALEAEQVKLRHLLRRSYRGITPVPEGTPVQYLGVYVTRWGKLLDPTHGFVGWEDDSIDALLSTPPGTDGREG